MKRWKRHVTNLNRILADDRISGSRRMLGQVLAMWMDASEDKKKLFELILIGTWGPTAKRVNWQDTDEDVVKETGTLLDIETRNQMKDAFATILGENT